MFGIDSSELAIIALVALLVIGPKDLPRVMRQIGQWMAKGRAMTRHVRAGFDTMMREAEMEEMQAQWAAQNEAIMKATAMPDLGINNAQPDFSTNALMTPASTGPALADPVPAEVAAPAKAGPRRRRAKPAAEATAPSQVVTPLAVTPPSVTPAAVTPVANPPVKAPPRKRGPRQSASTRSAPRGSATS